jgi:hypothetical protein
VIFRCFSVCLTLSCSDYQLWQNHLRNEGFISQDHIKGFSVKLECTNTTHKHTILWYLSYKLDITVWVPCIKFTKDEAKRALQRIEHSFCRSDNLSCQAHTLCPRREWAPLNDLRLRVQVGNLTLIDLDLPLIALISITGKRRKKILTCTQTIYSKSKAWEPMLSKTYPS